jgi:PKD repeat protein
MGISICAENNLVVSGAVDYDVGSCSNAGAVFIHNMNSTQWYPQYRITASDLSANAYFGSSVALHDSLLLIGSFGDNDNGAYSGSAYIFKRTSIGWQQTVKLQAPDGEANDFFGNSVAFSDSFAIVSSYLSNNGKGAVYIFRKQGNTWPFVTKIQPTELADTCGFGCSIALNDKYLLIGAPYQSTTGHFAGTTYLYKNDNSQWVKQCRINSPDGSTDDYFGFAVAFKNKKILVGAPGAVVSGVRSGAAYLYNYLNPNPEKPVALFSENPTSGTAPLTISFTNQSTGDIVSYSWDFGDGTTENAMPNPTHTYVSPGIYNVRLIANGPAESDTIIKNSLITVQAQIPQYQITISSGGNGTVSPKGMVTVTQGASISVTAVPSAGYHFLNWNVASGITINANSSAGSFTINGSGTIQANFSPNTYVITVNKTGNGTVVPSGDNTVTYGSDLTISAVADAGYHFVKWNINGSLNVYDPSNPVTLINNITSNGSITASFSSNTLPGNISIDSINTQSKVYLYTTNSWIGKEVLTGPGTINFLKPGIYRLCVINDNKRSFYKSVSVTENTTTYINASMGDAVPLIFTTKAQVLEKNNMPIKLNPAGSAIMDDIDYDGINELILASQSGIITIYKKIDGYSISKTFSLTLNSNDTVNCIRIADFDYDNTPELIVGLNTGRMLIADTNGSVTGTLYTTSTGLTSFDFIDNNKDNYPDILLGFVDGSIKVAQSTGNLTWNSPNTINSSVNSIATPIYMDLEGNGKPDIVSGNDSGEVNWFSDTGAFSFMARGSINSGGIPLKLSSITSLSIVYNDGTALPGVVTTDGSGNIFKVQSVICGDINSDGIVDILDLQQMGIHWGKIATDSAWSGQVNLSLTPGNDEVQVIDILDLQALGKSWGMVR